MERELQRAREEELEEEVDQEEYELLLLAALVVGSLLLGVALCVAGRQAYHFREGRLVSDSEQRD